MPPLVVAVSDKSFKSEVIGAQLPVLVSFLAEWCGPCKTMAAMLAGVALSGAANIKVCQVDIDESPGLAETYRIRGVPALVLFKNGEVLATKTGLLDSSRLDAFIRGNL